MLPDDDSPVSRRYDTLDRPPEIDTKLHFTDWLALAISALAAISLLGIGILWLTS